MDTVRLERRSSIDLSQKFTAPHCKETNSLPKPVAYFGCESFNTRTLSEDKL